MKLSVYRLTRELTLQTFAEDMLDWLQSGSNTSTLQLLQQIKIRSQGVIVESIATEMNKDLEDSSSSNSRS